MMVDLEKRKRIMERSIKLGHCICNPKQGCPCQLFKDKNICQCAGERIEDAVTSVPLTSLVENAGCASKIGQADLKKVLAGLPPIDDPRVLVSSNTCDDAGVFKLNDELALVQSVDVFTPNVDDAYTFGQIAAANSVSDIYAMGGTPLTALSVVAFPIESVAPAVMADMLRGGIDKLQEAGVVVVGGHSIKDSEVKFGFAVTGTVHPEKMMTNAAAKVGDILILTKPLGTGAISFARQLGRATEAELAQISDAMSSLNKIPAELMVEFKAHAATDVTGFGLCGHLGEMLTQSGVSATVFVDRVPVFAAALEYLRAGLISGAVERNREYAEKSVVVEGTLSAEEKCLFFDPQTSGGLLISIPKDAGAALLARLQECGINGVVIGEITAEQPGTITLCRPSGTDFNCIQPGGEPASQSDGKCDCCH